VFFSDSNGGNDTTATNPLSKQYAPLQQLFADLADNTVADYNWIAPDQYNDMHTSRGRRYGSDGRRGQHSAGRQLPEHHRSRDHGLTGVQERWCDHHLVGRIRRRCGGRQWDHLNHTIGEIVISPRARERGRTAVCASSVALTHSSNLRTMQETFHMTKPFFLSETRGGSFQLDDGAIPSH